MHSILTVTAPAGDSALTTLARVKLELGISGTDADRDSLLEAKIDEASSDIEAALGFRVPKETVQETFWHEWLGDQAEYLLLNRTPVAQITSITVDDVALIATDYRLDAETGQIYKLDKSGFPCVWYFCKSIVVVYSGGYIVPSETGRNLPPAIEGATIDLLSSFWLSRGRDPLIKSEEVPGVVRWDYWVGAVGEDGELPPSVVSKLARFRRVLV
jgi:hypothetical protein